LEMNTFTPFPSEILYLLDDASNWPTPKPRTTYLNQ